MEQHFGKDEVEKIIFSHDKTEVDAQYLIDDKPTITIGKCMPTWQWIKVLHKYNETLHPSCITPVATIANDWSDWQEAMESLGILKHKKTARQ